MDTREQQWDKFTAREGKYLTRSPDNSGDTASDPRVIQQTRIDAGAKLEPALLRIAATTGDGEMCKFLVKEGGIDVNPRFHEGYTALDGAAKLGQGEAVESLLAVGADARLQNHSKQTPRSVAIVTAATQASENLERVLDRPKEILISGPKAALDRLRNAPALEPKLAKGRSL